MPNKANKIIIVGGGIGGLTCAIALLQAGYEVRVYERAPQLNEVGAGITLWENALAVMRSLGVYERLVAVGQLASGGTIGTKAGAVVSQFSLADFEQAGFDMAMLALHRADLQRVLYESLPEGTVTMGRACTGFHQNESGVKAQFADGSDQGADLLIGADGIHSVIRKQLLNDGEPRYSGYTAWRGITPDWPERGGVNGEFWGRGRRFGIVPIGQGQLYFFATEDSPRGSVIPAGSRKQALLDRFGDWAFDIPDIIRRTPEQAILQNDIIDRVPTRDWSKGRVTLMGDAAHPTTPNMGQGAAMAIEDCPILVRALDTCSNHEQAFAVYEATRFPRSSMITDTSWRLGSIGQWSNPVATTLRNTLFRFIPKSTRISGLARIADYDASTAALVV